MEDFIAYGFFAKRTEDLSEEVGSASCRSCCALLQGFLVSFPAADKSASGRALGRRRICVPIRNKIGADVRFWFKWAYMC